MSPSPSSASPPPLPPLWLRVFQINDVYELDNFASAKTLVDTLKDETSAESGHRPDKTIFCLCGDFLGPSLLSSLDRGSGMVDCLNAIGVTHVCFGNHECDIPIQALPKRIEQSKFSWINSNMQDIHHIFYHNLKQCHQEYGEPTGKKSRRRSSLSVPSFESVQTSEYEIVEVRNETTGMTKQVALLGLLTNEDGLYRPNSFGGALIEPVMESAGRVVAEIKRKHDIDLFLPLTHQSMADDRIFCKHFGGDLCPIVLGGHDHTVFDETHNGSRIYKTGVDAHHVGVIDIVWDSSSNEDRDNDKPFVTAKLHSVAQYPPDPQVQHKMECHWMLLKELEQAKLFAIDSWVQEGQEFSTYNNRLEPSTGSIALVSMLRMGMRCECAIMNAGGIRGNRVYPNDHFFNWSDLQAEFLLPTDMTALYIPGRVLEASIKNSRKASKESPPIAEGGYLQTCDKIGYNNDLECIETMNGEPFDPARDYFTALPTQFLHGIDNHEDLLDWANENKININDDSALSAKLVIVEMSCALLWLQFGSFQEMDIGRNGILTRDSIRQGIMKRYGDNAVADLVVDNVMSIADLDGTGFVSPLDMMIVHFVATDMVTHVKTEVERIAAMRKAAAHVLGKSVDHPDVDNMVERIKGKLDTNGDGKIHREDNMKALGELRRRSLLI